MSAFSFGKLLNGRYQVTVRADQRVVGVVIRDRRSTDSMIAGTRQRRPGKGANVWRAEVPRDDFDHPRHSRSGDLLTHLPKTAGQLQHCFGGGYRLETFGETWDRREDAALALFAWACGDRGE